MVSKWGNCLGYSNLPCPSCGRIRLENYENGKQICEKCRWCPQEERYVESEEVYPTEENDVDSIGDYLIAELSKEVKGARDMSNKEYISKQEALSKLWRRKHHEDYDDDMFGEILGIEKEIKSMPGADVVAKEQYDHLLKLAKKMHTWIFLNAGDEKAVYDKIGLTNEDNALFGYGGRLKFSVD